MKTIERLLAQLAENEGYTPSFIPGVSFFKSSDGSPRTPLMYESRIIIVWRGEKIWYLNGKAFHYNTDNYLILSLPMAFECETKWNTLALAIDINFKLLGEIIFNFPPLNHENNQIKKAVHALPLKNPLSKSIIRLLEVARSAEESKILAEWILKEILYHVLKDQHGWALQALYQDGATFSRFAQLIHKINSNISRPYSLADLASEMAMSQTSLYRYFKKLTSEAPLTYIKNIRLQKAREMILEKDASIKEVSKNVGYKSVSQFSREFRRYFGVPPKQIQK